MCIFYLYDRNEVKISWGICFISNDKQCSWNNTTQCGISSPFKLLVAVQIRRECCVMESTQFTFLIVWQFTLCKYSYAYKQHSTDVAIAQVNDLKLGYVSIVQHIIPCCHHLLIPFWAIITYLHIGYTSIDWYRCLIYFMTYGASNSLELLHEIPYKRTYSS